MRSPRRIAKYLLSREVVRKLAAFRNNSACWLWDRWHGVDTRGIVPLRGLTIASPDARLDGLEYAAVHPNLISAMFRNLRLDWPTFTFIDLGCGKGRVLLQACERPFKKIIGVEFSKELYEIAVANLGKYRTLRRSCSDIEVVLADASRYELPPTPEVVYLFCPFGPDIMSRVLENLRESLDRFPREIVLVLRNPEWAKRVEQLPTFRPFRVLERTRYYSVCRPA